MWEFLSYQGSSLGGVHVLVMQSIPGIGACTGPWFEADFGKWGVGGGVRGGFTTSLVWKHVRLQQV